MSQNALVSLGRHLACKESPPFSLVVDSLAQSGNFILHEFVSKFSGPVILLSFESAVSPNYASHFLYCHDQPIQKMQEFVSSVSDKSKKSLVIVDSLNYTDPRDVANLVSAIALPQNSIVAVFHTNCPLPHLRGYPAPLTLLSYIALAIYDVHPLSVSDQESLDNSLARFVFPPDGSLNRPAFKLVFTVRRKSGKSLVHRFIVDSSTHQYEIYSEKTDSEDPVEDDLLKDLTTFNLSTSSKQKLAKEQVELPFMEAQQELGKLGGAIVYQFEKDDDYDEEDPYEDPF